MNVVNLWRRETVQLKVRILHVKSTQQILVPFNSEIRVESALHQNARAAKGNRFVNLPENLLKRGDVCVRLSRTAVESAEGADHVADVRVIYVAVNDVRDYVVRVPALANLVGCDAHARYVVRFQKRSAIVCGQTLARKRSV